ncbi:MAG: hypothetical protein GEV11_06270 [Streptosporangiales bacterium]|nr:hypothetical protein [Streptosporangiales bacterium]
MTTRRTTQEERFALLVEVPRDERPPSGDPELDRMLRLTDLLGDLGPGSGPAAPAASRVRECARPEAGRRDVVPTR